MKKLKFLMAVIAIALFSNLIFAVNPSRKDYTKNLGDNMLKRICKDIQLTDSQKLAIQTLAKDYEVKLKNKDLQTNPELKKTMNSQVVLEYRSKLNNILTKEQMDTLRIKRIQRSKLVNKNN